MRKNIIACGLVVLAAFATYAQSKKGGILQPQMTVETGSYEKPAGTLGTKPAAPWSNTTVAAAVDAKPSLYVGDFPYRSSPDTLYTVVLVAETVI